MHRKYLTVTKRYEVWCKIPATTIIIHKVYNIWLITEQYVNTRATARIQFSASAPFFITGHTRSRSTNSSQSTTKNLLLYFKSAKNILTERLWKKCRHQTKGGSIQKLIQRLVFKGTSIQGKN